MADVTTANHIATIHGKTNKHDSGYYYATPTGKQKYRTRHEDYQQNRSPKQLWHTQSFVWAHAEIGTIFSDAALIKQTEREYRAAMRRTPDGRVYTDAKGWKFAMLQLTWKQEHPFEQWYEDYLQNISDAAAAKTAAEDTSEYMLRRKLEELKAQAADIQARLDAKKKQ